MLELVLLFMHTYITPSGAIKSQEDICLDKILKLMLAAFVGICSYDKSLISECAIQWAPIFKSRSSSAINELLEISEEEVIQLLQSFCEKIQLDTQNSDFADREIKEALGRICSHLQGTMALLWGSCELLFSYDSG